MTKRKPLQRAAALLLCVFLCLGAAFSMMGAAYAANVEPSGITIEIMLPADWASASAAAKVCVTDETGGGFASVEVRVDRGGSWRNITASMERRDSRSYGTVDITSNCTVYVRVTGHDGQIYENSRYMECFDTTPPTLRASVSGDVLRVEAADDLSGVAHITVNGTCYPNLTGNAVDVPLKDLGTSEQITVQAADKAGNYSRTYQVKNPNYKAPATSQPPQMKKPTSTTRPSTTTPPSGSASVTPDTEQTVKPLTPNGQGTVVDNVTNQDSKEFFTFTTPSENTFYLVIDKQRESENVYFLNAVTESDLLALAEKEKKPEKGGNSTMILVVIAALAVGGAGYYLKIWKPKHDLDSAEDFDELTGEDEETVNEDDRDPTPRRGSHDEPEEPDYPEGYGYEEPEDDE